MLATGEIKVSATETFDSSLGWTKTALLGCNELSNQCIEEMRQMFMKKTNNFDFNALNAEGQSLGATFCEKVGDMPLNNLVLKTFTFCESLDDNASGSVDAPVGVSSEKKLKCSKGKPKVTDGTVSPFTLGSLLPFLFCGCNSKKWIKHL